MRQPEEVYGPASGYHTFIGEVVDGIGARDEDVIDMTNVTEWDDDYQLPWFDAGELHAIARAGANRMRRAAFAAMAEKHEGPVAPRELRRGIPAW